MASVSVQAKAWDGTLGKTYRVTTVKGLARVVKVSPGEGWGWAVYGTRAALEALGGYETVQGDWCITLPDERRYLAAITDAEVSQ